MLGCAPFAKATEPPPVHLEVRLDQSGLLTLEARDAPLADVLTAVGAQAGFETVIAGPIATTVTISLERLPVTVAVERLLSGADYATLHDTAGRQGDVSSLVRVWLLADSASPGEPPRAAGERRDGEAATAAVDDGKLRSEELLRLVQDGATPEVLETLGHALEWDAEPLVRTRAAIALGTLGDERAVGPLQSALGDEHPTVRRHAVQALSQIAVEDATLALGDVLLNEFDTRLRVLAAWGLWRHDSDLARSFLAQVADDLDEAVQAAATRAPPAVMHGATPTPSQDAPPVFENAQ